ncbi:MAG: DHA2 family efflux MFS transporter permease subunit [Oscillatoriales cyanobacterium]|nr:MAG: DHA2 family efflux MFS transporter permease subunit [Oscillatoriales cyanobacterium]TAH15741.1 MAG: DHA2 family efflux MFS transporter permease subunit [Oscillatoriales cyanobacterium]
MVTTSKMSSEQSNEPTQEPRASGKWWALLSIGLGVLMFSVDVSIVYISLPTLVEALHTSFATIQWVSLSYLLSITVLLIGVGRLGDMFGKKSLYLGGLIVFTISSLLCGLAPTVGFLIGFRALQGLGAVFISALGAAIVTEIFADSGRGLALGIIGAISSLGMVLGPTVGGLLIGLGNWRLIFLVNVPIGIVTCLILVCTLPSSVGSETEQRFDALGSLIMAVMLSCFALGMTFGQREGFSSPIVLALLSVAAFGLVCFLVVEARILQPMLDLGIFRNLQLSLSLLAGWMVYIVTGSTIFILPFFLELVEHYSTQKVGLLQAVLPIAVALMEPISGILSDRFGWRIISLIGLVVMVCGCLAIATLDTELTVLGYIARVALLGLGFGIFLSPNNSAIMGGVPQERFGIASALLSLCRVLGHMIGIPLLGGLFATLSIASADIAPDMDVTNAPVEALISAEHTTFIIAALILMVSAMLLIFGMFQDRHGTDETSLS